MKNYFAIILIVIFVFSLAGCHSHQPSGQDTSSSSEINSISECLTEEYGDQYLILPISKVKMRVSDQYTQYVDDVDLDLLKAAEEKISGEFSRHSNHSGFYLTVNEGYLCLCAEVIVDIDPPASADNMGGCGVDHEHKFFCERITK